MFNYRLLQCLGVKNQCIDNCINSTQYQYEYNDKCYSNCPNGLLSDNTNIINNKCKCELEKYLKCPTIALSLNLCTECNNNYYPMENDPSNRGEYINCYNQTPTGYYLDNIQNIYKSCYYTCETCEINGDNINHKCTKCKKEFNFEKLYDKYKNCYEECEYLYYYFDNINNEYHCTTNDSCPKEYPKLIQDEYQCFKSDIRYLENVINDLLKFEEIKKDEEKEENIEKNEELTKQKEIDGYNQIIKKVESIFTSDVINMTNIDNGKDQVIKTEKITISFTNTENQKKMEGNTSTVNLGDCEALLRKHYNLTNNETIYMKKMDIVQEGTKAQKIEYDVYSRLSGKNLVKLNLTVCGDTKILLNIPIIISENIDKLNTSSGYFKDICYSATSDDGTDISLLDRKNDYIKGDNIICQEDCFFSEYDYNNKKAKCECKVKESSSSFEDMKINKVKLFENLKDFKNFANINILICYKKLLNNKNIYNNIGCLIIICIIIFHFICIFAFYKKQSNNIIKYIEDIIFGITNINLISNDKDNDQKNLEENKILDKKIECSNNIQDTLSLKRKIKAKKRKNLYIKNNNISNNIKITTDNNVSENIKKYNENRSIIQLQNSEDRILQIKKIMNYNNDELNELTFNLALEYDKRTYCQYYNALLKSKHIIIFTFFNTEDYNPRIIKIDLFFIGFAVFYAINALFFNDDTMHKIYVNKGTFDLETQIPITIYSSLISIIFDTLLTFLALSNDNLINFKQNRKKSDVKQRGDKLRIFLKIKIIIYFVVSFIMLLFFWYYISMFGVIYINTQYHLLKDTLLSYGLSLIYPFLIYLLPGIFRIPSLSNHNKKRECLYNFSKILQFI